MATKFVSKIPKQQTKDRQINDLQDRISQATQNLRNGPFNNGNLIQSIKFTAGNQIQQIAHGLGRSPQNVIFLNPKITDNDYLITFTGFPALAWITEVTGEDTTIHITVAAGGTPMTCDVYVS